MIKKSKDKYYLLYPREYRIWAHIKSRCYNNKVPYFSKYGGRGISMYYNWIDNPTEFINYIIKLDNYNIENFYSIDRINNNGNYEPGNLRWANRNMQNSNQRIRKCNKTGYVGVWYNKKNRKYHSLIYINKNKIELGVFIDKNDALICRNNFIIQNKLESYEIQKII